MAKGYGIWHALNEMGRARDDIVGQRPFKMIQGPTSVYCALTGESSPEFKLSVDVMSQRCI